MIPHGNLKPSFCTSWPILFLLEYALLDEHLSYFTEEEHSDCIKPYSAPFFTVGNPRNDVPKGSKDWECADFCLKNKCDFITTDKKAWAVIFSVSKKVKSINIKQILEKEPTESNRPVYSLHFETKSSWYSQLLVDCRLDIFLCQ